MNSLNKSYTINRGRKIDVSKNLITTLIILLFTFFSVSAQIKRPTVKIPDNRRVNPSLLDKNLNLTTIKNNIKANKSCYLMYLSTTTILPPKNGARLKEVVGYFGGGKYIKVERDYLRINDLLLRSDNRFSRSAGNNYEVLIYPERSNPSKID